MDLFDPKPLIQKLAGQRMPDSFKRPITPMGEAESPILAANANGNATAKAACGSAIGCRTRRMRG